MFKNGDFMKERLNDKISYWFLKWTNIVIISENVLGFLSGPQSSSLTQYQITPGLTSLLPRYGAGWYCVLPDTSVPNQVLWSLCAVVNRPHEAFASPRYGTRLLNVRYISKLHLSNIVTSFTPVCRLSLASKLEIKISFKTDNDFG